MTQAQTIDIRLAANFSTLDQLLDIAGDAKQPEFRVAAIMSASVVFAVATIEAMLADMGEFKQGEVAENAVVRVAGPAVHASGVRWMKGMRLLRNDLVHRKPASEDARAAILAADLPVIRSEFTRSHAWVVRNGYSQVSTALSRAWISRQEGIDAIPLTAPDAA